MKTILLLSIITVVSLQAYSQQDVIKFDLVSPLSRKIRIGYEASFSEKISAQFMFQSGRLATEDLDESSYTLSSTGILTEIRVYPFSERRTAPFGFFVGGAFRFMRYSELYNRYSWNMQGAGTYHNLGVDVGYKINYRRFCIEVLGGYGIGSVKTDDPNRDYVLPTLYGSLLYDEKKFIRTEVSIGYLILRGQTK